MAQQIETDEAPTLSTQDWIEIARAVLIRDGIANVKIDRLARECGVTRGGFYWRFKNRDELLQALLADWRTNNSDALLAAMRGPGCPADRFRAVAQLWREETSFSPDFDTAVRQWARVSPEVARQVREVDDMRVEALRELFIEAGYADDEAFIRARITYFHQVGYYALQMHESPARRAELSELYHKVLQGPLMYG